MKEIIKNIAGTVFTFVKNHKKEVLSAAVIASAIGGTVVYKKRKGAEEPAAALPEAEPVQMEMELPEIEKENV